MTTQTAEKIYKEVKALRQETKTLKELFFLILKDYEGEYKNSFIKRILKKSRSKPQFIFINKKEFLKQIS
ncbi:hypothetical protein COT96_00515 [Candidatus Falkowbacteria bacterium CG10_big_fil_rev_8_21_14_0_10_38_22]|uniref:Uncharacterized protein n=2 Tax=Parcubacteria group TaxID=1794811 RepID=A0A2M6WS20_9BACT|nr:MAG: hypothetical protein AUJ36_02130 [Parcubacteria group bacterium CG1_02_41_26]OIP55670.1 MAG: hypothetical protein AUK13_02565 [Candidatus Kuenenbacteria bacterium CG2_30_39_24]PIT95565.1 MAG: hypothetical protein COT96_00515 [Candidatus Falkowbacteria bacterium CG10_big_fil_rev_8_21_14_0_10_38_22]